MQVKQASSGNLSLGTNTGFQPTGSTPDVAPNAGAINQQPDGGVAGVLGATTGGGNTGGGAPAPTGRVYDPLNQAAVDNTQIALDQLPGLLRAALQAEETAKRNAMAEYDEQQRQQQANYDGSTVTNQQNYDANFMDSIRAGIKGLGGLFNLLRGTGAAGGTAQDQVRDVVGGITANDIRTGADTQKENQTALDTSLQTFLTDLGGKRRIAGDTFTNNTRAIERDNYTQMQDLYSKMAGLFGDAGMTDRANDFLGKAGELTPRIAENSRRAVSAYDTTPVVVQAPEISAFAAPSQPQVAVAPQNGQVGSGIFTMNRKKDQQNSVALPVGA